MYCTSRNVCVGFSFADIVSNPQTVDKTFYTDCKFDISIMTSVLGQI